MDLLKKKAQKIKQGVYLWIQKIHIYGTKISQIKKVQEKSYCHFL